MKTLKPIFPLILFLFIFFIKGKAQDTTHKDMNEGMSKHVMLNESDLQWGEPPPGLPKGAKVTVVNGDPTKEMPFVMRAEFPANYKIQAHWHPTTENVTVIKGTLYVGTGEKFDESKAMVLNLGGYASMPAKAPHYAFTKEGCTIQVHGMGPFGITYINPADDPTAKK